MDKTIDPQVQTMIDNMSEKTGNTLEGWFSLIKAQKVEKHGEIMKLLKGSPALPMGMPNTITLLYRQNLAAGPVSKDDLVSAQYSKKAHMKPWYDKLIAEVNKFGDDVDLAPKKSYVSLRRAKQFGIIQPSVKTRMDLGINLKGQKASGVLIEGDKWSGMCSHRIEIFSPNEINEK